MYVCICKKVTDHQIRDAVYQGEAQNLRHLKKKLGACSQCGKCAAHAKEVLNECLSERNSIPLDTCIATP